MTTAKAWTARLLACAAMGGLTAAACGGSVGYPAYAFEDGGFDDAADGAASSSCGSCAGGCCDSTGTCQPGNTDDACGPAGGSCTNCQNAGQTCMTGAGTCTGGASSSGGPSSSGSASSASSGGNPLTNFLMMIGQLFKGGGRSSGGTDSGSD
ncbi:MAG: hypothetical protein ACRENE_20585 [Polyangiaceae bacterium]